MKTDLRGLLTEEEEEETKISSIGIQMRKNGRYAAVITDRIRHKRVWLGTFDTVEEASQAYFAKKTEFEKLNLGNKEDRLKKNCDPHKTTQFVGVRKRKDSGKYISEIRNPISKKRIWLGTFNTAEEASRAYQSKNLQFQKLVDSKRQCSSNKQTHSTLKSAGGSEIDVTISNLSNGRTEQRIDSHEIGTDEEGFRVYHSEKKQASKVFNSGLMANVYGEESSDECNTTTHCDPKVKISLVGIRMRKSGRYAARITDPVRHKRVWLGTFDTVEEASQAYFAKKTEFEKLNLGNKEDRLKKNCDPHKTTQFVGVRKRKDSGKYISEIRNPISKKRVWLGTFDTAEEASRAYQSKNLQFQKLADSKRQCSSNKQTHSTLESADGSEIDVTISNLSNGRTEQRIDSHEIGTDEEGFHVYPSKKKQAPKVFNSGLMANVCGEKSSDECNTTTHCDPKVKRSLVGIRRRKSGRYAARITDPIRHKRVWLGTFDTVEEASWAYFSKKSEFEKLSELGNKENKPQKMSDQIQHDTTRCDPKVKRNLIGITRRKSGRYAATITDRIRHKRVWLGTFDTVEEASRAYFSKKTEFEKLSQQGEKKSSDQIQQPVAASLSMANDQTLDTPNLGSRRKKRHDSHKTTRFFRVHKRKDSGKYTSEIRDPINKKRIWLGTFDTAEEASRAYQSKNLEFQKLVEEKQQQCVGQEDDEELWMGQWVQLPGDDDRAIMFSLKLGLPIIDNYGYLLGGFSSLDDLSIC